MKVLISADMEGVTGVTCPDDCEPGHSRWDRCRGLLTGDVNAAVAGFADAGAQEIIVNEAHADMRNLLIDQLDPRATLLIGTHKPLGMMEGIDRSPDLVAFVGYHTGAGEPGVLAHTYLPNSITSVRVNGEMASEGRMNAMLAAEYGVPVALVTGDDLTCADAATYAPTAVGVAVKTCIDRYAAICLPPAVSASRITEGARLAGGRTHSLTSTGRPVHVRGQVRRDPSGRLGDLRPGCRTHRPADGPLHPCDHVRGDSLLPCGHPGRRYRDRARVRLTRSAPSHRRAAVPLAAHVLAWPLAPPRRSAVGPDVPGLPNAQNAAPLASRMQRLGHPECSASGITGAAPVSTGEPVP